MKKLIFRLFFIIIIGVGLLVYVFPWNSYGIEMPFTGKEYKLGLDLQGGIELDYKIDLDDAKKESDYNAKREKEIIEGLKSIIDKRIETLNINDSVITTASYSGEQHIIVQIPMKGNNSIQNNTNIEKAKKAIGKVVKIIFKEKRVDVTQEDLNIRLEIADNIIKNLKNGELFSLISDKYFLNYEKILVGNDEKISEKFILDNDIKKIKHNIIEAKTIAGEEGFLILDIDNKDINNYIFVYKEPSRWMIAKDSQGRLLDDKYFIKSSVQFDEAYNAMIELTFNNEGAKIFGEISKRLVGQQLAIFVGGEMLTDPVIQTPIYGGKAVITGDYTSITAGKLSQEINTGVVPAPIYLTSEKTIDSKLGKSSLQKLIIAGLSGFILILIFLIIIYKFSGLMASIALLMYIVLVLTVIKSFAIVLTMASIAGLILSIGMAIDANILIFERIRDELKNGENIHNACSIGFKKSWSAIWDSNVTGFVVAIILFVFGINIIKGFGLMLAIGIVISLFSTMFISRVLVNLLSEYINNKKFFIGFTKK